MAKKLIKVYATWCGPCSALTAQLKSLDLTEDQLQSIDVESEEYNNFPHKAKTLPTVFVMDGDDLVETISGVKRGNIYLEALK